MKKLLVALVLALGVCAGADASAQSLILETATFNPAAPGGAGDWDIYPMLFYGARFEVSDVTDITRVGVGNLTGNGQFFLAIVRVTGAVGSGVPYDQQDVLGSVTFTPAGGDLRVPLALTLGPGQYMLVLGSIDGIGKLWDDGQTVNPGSPVYYGFSQPPFPWTPASMYSQTLNSSDSGTAPLRLVVEGTNAHTAILDSIATRASQQSVDAIATKLNALDLTGLATSTDVTNAALALSNTLSKLATQTSLDVIGQSVGTNGDTAIRMAIERALADGRRVVTFYAPSTAGGKLDIVRDVVIEALNEAQAAGVDTTKARAYFAKGETAFGAADYRGAYDDYGAAYQLLLK